MTRILVTGVTGHLGSAAVDRLVAAAGPDTVVGLARDAAKGAPLQARGVEVRLSDYDDPDGLRAAMTGIDKVLLVSARDQDKLLRQHENVIRAAERAGISHLVYTGTAVRDWEASPLEFMLRGHFDTEQALRDSDVPFTILRNSMYADALPFFIGADAMTQGICIPAGNGRTPFALRREMGEAAANVLLRDGHEGKTYELTASEGYTFADVAALLSAHADTDVSYEDVSPESHTTRLREAGIPEAPAQGLTAFITDMRDGRYDIVTDDLANLLGRKSTPLGEAIAEVFPVR